MIRTSTFNFTGTLYIALVSAMLSACATTQRSSSGSTEQDATPPPAASTPAPPEEVVATPVVAAPAETPPAPKAVAKPDEGEPMVFPVTNNAVTEESPPEQPVEEKPAEPAAPVTESSPPQEAPAAPIENQEPVQEAAPAPPPPETPAPAAETPAPAAETPPPAKAAAAPAKEEEALVFPEQKYTAPETPSQPSISKPGERSVYFNYDEAVVLSAYDSLILTNAAYLRDHPQLRVEVQGNCDERGSREYNLALGARRAETVKRALELGGADGSKIHAISFGKEKPVAMGHDEESWSKNRRADIVY
jgi:peptidoglycan-associated lipoprotein